MHVAFSVGSSLIFSCQHYIIIPGNEPNVSLDGSVSSESALTLACFSVIVFETKQIFIEHLLCAKLIRSAKPRNQNQVLFRSFMLPK